MKLLLISFSVGCLLLGVLNIAIALVGVGGAPMWLTILNVFAAGFAFFTSGYCAASAQVA